VLEPGEAMSLTMRIDVTPGSVARRLEQAFDRVVLDDRFQRVRNP
jgi:hypothetical protein